MQLALHQLDLATPGERGFTDPPQGPARLDGGGQRGRPDGDDPRGIAADAFDLWCA